MATQPDNLTSRPTRGDPAVRAKAIAALADDCARWEGGEGLAVNWIAALQGLSLYGNGYELARNLESAAYIDPDAELVEILDSARTYLWYAHDEAVAAGVQASNIKPSLPIGQRAKYRSKLGTITGFQENIASYLFVPDADKEYFANGGGNVVAYESVHLVPVSSEEVPA